MGISELNLPGLWHSACWRASVLALQRLSSGRKALNIIIDLLEETLPQVNNIRRPIQSVVRARFGGAVPLPHSIQSPSV